jgi:hypothetical protein
MIGTVGAWDAGGDEAGVLEEVEVTPGCLLPVMWFAEPSAGRTRKARTRFGRDRKMQFVGLLVGVQALVDHAPGVGQSQAKGEYVAARQWGGLHTNRYVVRAWLVRPALSELGAVLAAVKDASRRAKGAVAFGHP